MACESTPPIVATQNIIPPTVTTTPSNVPAPTATPVVWPLQIQLDSEDQPTKASMNNLLQLAPGTSTLADLYATVGYPHKRRDFASGIALEYPSLWVKSPYVVVVDGKTGTVMVVSIENVSKPIFSLPHLKAMYGEPKIAYADARDYLFFENAGIAAIAYPNGSDKLLYVQLLPKDMTPDEYKAHQGYWQETFSFVP